MRNLYIKCNVIMNMVHVHEKWSTAEYLLKMHHYLHDKVRNFLAFVNNTVPLYMHSAMSMTLYLRN